MENYFISVGEPWDFESEGGKNIIMGEVGIPLKLIRRSAATWKCVPPIFDQGVLGGLTRYSGAN